MALTSTERQYVKNLVELLRSERPLDDFSPSFRTVPIGQDILGYDERRGLNRWERDGIAAIIQWFFKRKDGKKQGRPPDTMLEKWANYTRLLTNEQLVDFERSDGKSRLDAISNVAKRKELSPSVLKSDLARLKRKKPKLYNDEERTAFEASDVQHKFVVLVQDEMNRNRTYDEAVRAVAKRQHIDAAKLKRIVKPVLD